jgi:hypothetical protein
MVVGAGNVATTNIQQQQMTKLFIDQRCLRHVKLVSVKPIPQFYTPLF